MARDSDGIFSEKWADGGDTGEPVGFDRNLGWPLSYSQPGGEYPTRPLYNLLWKEISALAIELNQNGVGLEYNATIDYVAKAIVRGSDGDYYIATAANGPATAAVDPVGDLTGVWENYYLNTSAYVATGTANAIVLNAISGINPTALFDGQILTFKATATSTGAATIQIGSLGTQAVTMPGGNALAGGEIVTGIIYSVLYVKASTRFELILIESVSRGHIDGLIMSNGTDTDHDIDVSIGEAADSTGAYLMRLTSAMTKQIDVAWAAGDNAGGMFTGAVAVDTWYHFFEIRKDSDSTIDFGFDTSLTASNKPAGYSNYRYVGSVLTDGSSNIYQFTQIGDWFIWHDPQADFSELSGTTEVTKTIRVPPGTPCLVKFNWNNDGNCYIYFRHPDTTNIVPANNTLPYVSYGVARNMGEHFVHTNESAQIKYRSSVNVTLKFSTIYYVNPRGKDA